MKGWMESGRGGKVVLVLVSLLVLGLSAAAWAMKDQEMELTYPANPKAYGKEVVKVSPAPTPGIEVSVVRFEDSRTGKKPITEMISLACKHVADILAKNDEQDWATDALKTELTNAGYKATVIPSKDQAKAKVVISASLLNVYDKAVCGVRGLQPEAAFSVVITKDGKELLNQKYTGKKSAVRANPVDDLALSLQQAILSLVNDLNKLNLADK